MSPEEKLKMFLSLWMGENDIKTKKLNYFFIVQAILITVISLKIEVKLQILVACVGIFVSFILYFSIGRTVVFQRLWEQLIRGVLIKNEGLDAAEMLAIFDGRIKFPFYGSIPSKTLALFPPIFLITVWFFVFVYLL